MTSASPWFNELQVRLANTSPITALTVTVVVQRTTGVSHSGQYNTVGGQITQSNASTAATVTYTWTLGAGQTLNAVDGAHLRGAARRHGHGAPGDGRHLDGELHHRRRRADADGDVLGTRGRRARKGAAALPLSRAYAITGAWSSAPVSTPFPGRGSSRITRRRGMRCFRVSGSDAPMEDAKSAARE